MTRLLLRLFVGENPDFENPGIRAAVGSLSGAVGIVCNLLLFAGKLAVGILTGSVGITADAMNNLSDASSSIVTLLGFRLARRPADADHPYGHARYEYLTALAVAVMIMVIGVELARSSVGKILYPAPVEFSGWVVLTLGAAMAVKLWLCLFNGTLGKRIGSSALRATAADSRNDVLATAAVLLGALAEHFWNLRIDGFVGLGVALFILWSGWNLARETISPLLGEAADPELREKILDYVSAQPDVLGYHDLMVHDYGPGQRFASLHVEMDAGTDPLYCHERIDDMERECLRSHNVHLLIHYDPVITDDPGINRTRGRVEQLLTREDPRITIHDFRMIRHTGYTNLVFDMALPADLQGKQRQIQTRLEQGLKEEGNLVYRLVITFDLAI